MKVRLVHDQTQTAWESDAPPESVRERIVLVGDGGTYTLLVDAGGGPPAFQVLTERQRSVAERACLGLTTRAIADDLGIGVETVRSHLKSIYGRLGVAGRTELARVATGDLVLPEMS